MDKMLYSQNHHFSRWDNGDFELELISHVNMKLPTSFPFSKTTWTCYGWGFVAKEGSLFH